METIRNLLKPGAKDDDKTLYDSGSDPNRGKVAGEGSHFSHGHSDSGVGGVNSPTSSNNPATGLTGSSATKTAEPTSATSAVSGGEAPIGTASTTSGDRAFPLSNTGTGSTANPSSQAGAAGHEFNTTDRTAAGTVPAAVGTTAAAAAQPTTSSTAQTSTVGATQPSAITTSGIQEGTAPHSHISSSNAQTVLSPKQPADDVCTDTVHGGPHQTQIARKIDPCYEDQSTVGVPSTIGSTSTTSQPTTTSTSRSEALTPGAGAATAGVTGSSATKTADPVASTSHSSAVPAAVGAGAGAGLVGASAAGSQHTSGQTSVDNHAGRASASTATTVPTTASSGVAETPIGTTTSAAHPYSEKAVDPRIDSGSSQYKTLDPAADQRAVPDSKEQEHHYGRDAAVGGAAGAGAGALAGHEYSKKEAEQAVKEEKKIEKEHEKEAKHAQKEHEKEVKQAEKQHEKDLKKQEKEEKPGLIDRLLHRGDAKKDNHNGEKVAAAGAATGAGAGAVHEHNKLHKEPPPGYAQEPSRGYASQVTGGTGTTALAQGNENILPSGSTTGEPLPSIATVPGTRYGSGHDEHTASSTTGGTSTQPEYYQNDPALGIKRDSVAAAGGTVQSTTPYLPAPQKGYASQVTGGTGTTQLAEGNLDPVTNPTKSNPLDQGKYGPLGYASTVTGGTGTTQLAEGTTTTVPTEGMAPGRSGSIAGVATTETQYVDGPKAGTGKYADQVTGGTGTTQLAQGHLDEVANPRSQSIADKVEGALVMK